VRGRSFAALDRQQLVEPGEKLDVGLLAVHAHHVGGRHVGGDHVDHRIARLLVGGERLAEVGHDLALPRAELRGVKLGDQRRRIGQALVHPRSQALDRGLIVGIAGQRDRAVEPGARFGDRPLERRDGCRLFHLDGGKPLNQPRLVAQ
jgi:hypothetical protein